MAAAAVGITALILIGRIPFIGFIGAIAIPAAVQGYAATVQVLLGELFADPAFKQATDPAPAQP